MTRLAGPLCLLAMSTAFAEDPPPAESSSSYVQPLDLKLLAERLRALPPRDRALVDLYLEGAQRTVLTLEDGAFPDAGTEHWRNIAERAHGAAVLSALPGAWPEDLRERCRRESAEFVKEFAAQFAKVPLMGNPWQSSWWTAEMGTAAWFLWDRLEPVVQATVADMIVFHADRIAGTVPPCRVDRNTEAETLAWNSTILSLAGSMMARHPHAAQWDRAVKRYVYSIFATPRDAQDGAPGDEGKPVRDWIYGANIHDDFSLENHNRFHIDYEFTCYRFILYGAAMCRLGGKALPAAFTHHTADVYEQVLLPCLDGGKFAVYVSDNDWRRYHAWTESPMAHGYVALTSQSPLASALEAQALTRAAARWRKFPPGFSYPNPYACGKAWTPRIADIVLLHLLSPPSPPPLPDAEVETKLAGVHAKQDIDLTTQYSSGGSFRSFYGGPGPVVRHVEPRDDDGMMLHLETNYGVRLTPARPRKADEERVHRQKGEDWFWVIRDVGAVREGFVSLPDETVVILGEAPVSALQNVKSVECPAGVDRPFGALTLHHRGGRAEYRYGGKQWDRTDGIAGLDLKTDWVNLADRIGYVVVNLSEDPSQMFLPEPGARDSLRLYRVLEPKHDQRFMIVAFPNQAHEQTEARAADVGGSYADGVMTCSAPPWFLWANFRDRATNVPLPAGLHAEPVEAAPNSVGAVREGKRIF